MRDACLKDSHLPLADNDVAHSGSSSVVHGGGKDTASGIDPTPEVYYRREGGGLLGAAPAYHYVLR